MGKRYSISLVLLEGSFRPAESDDEVASRTKASVATRPSSRQTSFPVARKTDGEGTHHFAIDEARVERTQRFPPGGFDHLCGWRCRIGKGGHDESVGRGIRIGWLSAVTALGATAGSTGDDGFKGEWAQAICNAKRR